jgi:hypothetical protein
MGKSTKDKRRKRCFVVMGFGKKPDFATGRTLNLDSSYHALIKPVVEQAGLECIRADEILHTGVIDVPMYQQLLLADVVIADISTVNANAIYELGVRHALRPRTTIVISEDQLKYPFDLNHISISKYAHLGDDIAIPEAERFRAALGKTLAAVLKENAADSPVFTFLPLPAPDLKKIEEAIQAASQQRVPLNPDDKTLAYLMTEGERAVASSDFNTAKAMFRSALVLSGSVKDGGAIREDAHILQRLALSTYKAELPDKVAALNEAMEVLAPLTPEDSHDPETIGLAGAIEKRLYENDQGLEHLAYAVRYYTRGYYLRNDWYNGINLAYLLNARADALANTDQDRIADLVGANRIRREVLGLCQIYIRTIEQRDRALRTVPEEIKKEQAGRDREQTFWCLASKAEAHFGLGETEMFESTRAEAAAGQPSDWMIRSLDQQIEKLRLLLRKHGHLLDPAWQESSVHL